MTRNTITNQCWILDKSVLECQVFLIEMIDRK